MIVEFRDEQHRPSSPSVDVVALAEAVLTAEGVGAGAEVALLFVDRDRIAELNERHLGKSGPTDVLAFPLDDLAPGATPAQPDGGAPLALGDVVICPEVVAGNAQARAVAFEDEMALMVVHGVLHLLGYDHVDDAEAEVMEARERALLAAAGRVRS